LLIKKGRTTERFTLHIQNEEIPSIVKSPITCLSMWFDTSLQNKRQCEKLKNQVGKGLKKIDH